MYLGGVHRSLNTPPTQKGVSRGTASGGQMSKKPFLGAVPCMYIPPFLLSNIIPVAIAIPPLLFNLQNRVIPTPEMRHLGFQKWSYFWSPSGTNSGAKMAPKIPPKLVKKTIISGPIFGTLFSGFGAIWVPLGSLHGLFEAVLGSLGPQKP